MVTELRQLLHETVDEPPAGGIDHSAVLRAGRECLRRRRRLTIGTAAAAVAVVGAAVLLPGQAHGPEERVLPAAPVRLSLGDARPVVPQVVARTRTLQEPGNYIDYDRIDGVTDDGLVVRARYTSEGDLSEYGLIDPVTGTTGWLPRPTWDIGSPLPLDLGADRLLFLDARDSVHPNLLAFDRNTNTWTYPRLDLPNGNDRFFGMYGQLGDDERVYFPDLSDAAEPDWSSMVATRPWWSAPVAGGAARHEAALDGLSVTWSGVARATADGSGRILVTEDGATHTVAEATPAGCTGFPALNFAGSRLLARYECADGSMIVVFDDTGAPELSVEAGRLAVAAAGDRYALLDGGTGTYLLDLDRQQLLRLGRTPAVAAMDLLPTPVVNGDLVVWNVWGPADSKLVSDVSDIVYRAVRLP